MRIECSQVNNEQQESEARHDELPPCLPSRANIQSGEGYAMPGNKESESEEAFSHSNISTASHEKYKYHTRQAAAGRLCVFVFACDLHEIGRASYRERV